MLTPSPMELINIVILKEKTEEVTSHLLKLGIFHPVDIRHVEEELKNLSSFQTEKEYTELGALEIRLMDIVRRLNISLPQKRDAQSFSYEGIKEIFHSLEERLSPLLSRKAEIEGELRTKESIRSQIKEYASFPAKGGALYTFLEVSLGRIAEKDIPVLERSLKDIPHLIYPFRKEGERVVAVVIGLKRDKALLEKVLKDLFWEKVEQSEEPRGGLSRDIEEKLKFQIEECKTKMKAADEGIKKLGESVQEDLSKIQFFLFLKKSLLEAKKYSCMTEKTVLLSGWIPREEKEAAVSEIKRAAGVSYVEEKRPEELTISKDEIPVRLTHTAFFKPFELLIDSYGMPRYGTIDPTVFVAISFLLMFGAMFGDVGQGLVLALASLFIGKGKSEKVRQASVLLRYCGISSAFFGMLYGSFFGIEYHSVWLRPIQDMFVLFRVSIFFGVSMITLGILFNVINALRDRNYVRAIFDKAGLIAGVIYWVGIGLATKLLILRTPVPSAYVMVFIVGFALLFFKPIIESIAHKKKEGIFVAFMEGVIEILEIVMVYLANTVSFVRIAAFSLAHVGLFFAIFELARLEQNVGAGIVSLLTLVVGNALIILLEGLVVTIQSLRLSYYEFFSKFFVTGKHAYKPLTIS